VSWAGWVRTGGLNFLSADTERVNEILSALSNMTARVVCVATGFSGAQLEPFRKNHMLYALRPVDLQPLLDACLCITYGAEGTMMRFLMAGVPQIVAPWHVETYMAARRIEAEGLGLMLNPHDSVAGTLLAATGDVTLHRKASAFAVDDFKRQPLLSNVQLNAILDRVTGSSCVQFSLPSRSALYKTEEVAPA